MGLFSSNGFKIVFAANPISGSKAYFSFLSWNLFDVHFRNLIFRKKNSLTPKCFHFQRPIFINQHLKHFTLFRNFVQCIREGLLYLFHYLFFFDRFLPFYFTAQIFKIFKFRRVYAFCVLIVFAEKVFFVIGENGRNRWRMELPVGPHCWLRRGFFTGCLSRSQWRSQPLRDLSWLRSSHFTTGLEKLHTELHPISN